VPELKNDPAAEATTDYCRTRLAEHRRYVAEYGDDMPDVRDWRWDTDRSR
jgi:xylulose-5-phosphate/fructose-6-phosphate phosphoketolase